MLSFHDRSIRLCDGISRREMLRIGGLSTFGLSLPKLLQAAPQALIDPDNPTDRTFGRAKSVIVVWLQGGPPQHETFDPKPEAPVEIRGPFKPIQTNVPGTFFGELLPRTARIADKLAVCRSLFTNDNNHDSSGYWVLTGYKYQGPNSRTIQPTDWPYLGSIVKRLKPSDTLPPLSVVWLPEWLRLNENVTPAGQTGGFMGRQWDPERVLGDPRDAEFKVEGLETADLPPLRLRQRIDLLTQVERHFDLLHRGEAARIYDQYQRQAFDLLTSDRARRAFRIQDEPQTLRERYGNTKWGQSLLLARRLVEAGVRLVHVNWCREPGEQAVDNPAWDTHAQNADRLEDFLCPIFDVGFTALMEDLQQRGLLDETLVVVASEFGRTPKINPSGGRDHWGPVFFFALAGAGIAGGQVYGASDKIGGYPAKDPVSPGDLTATIFHLLGIRPSATFHDREGREHRITTGRPLYAMLGTEPATTRRVPPGGDVARLAPFSTDLLLNTTFAQEVPLYRVDLGSRPKGWRAAPQADADRPDALCVRYVDGPPRHAVLGFGGGEGTAPQKFDQGARAVLAQEIRNPRVGKVALQAELAVEASSRDLFRQAFLKHFACKLRIYRYTEDTKNPLLATSFAELTVVPPVVESGRPLEYETFTLEAVFDGPAPGQNFSVGKGLGVALALEKHAPGTWELPGGDERARVLVHVRRMQLDYRPRGINEDVVT